MYKAEFPLWKGPLYLVRGQPPMLGDLAEDSFQEDIFQGHTCPPPTLSTTPVGSAWITGVKSQEDLAGKDLPSDGRIEMLY